MCVCVEGEGVCVWGVKVSVCVGPLYELLVGDTYCQSLILQIALL